MTNCVKFSFSDGSEYISHHGILGQKWGVRRYQNADGSLTRAGRLRYGRDEKIGKLNEKYEKISTKAAKIGNGKDISQMSKRQRDKLAKQTDKLIKVVNKSEAVANKYEKKIKDAETKDQLDAEKKAYKEEKERIKTAKAAAKNLEKKQKLLEEGNWKEVYANKKMFTTDELNSIANRIDAEKRLKGKVSGLDDIKNLVDKTISYADTGLKAYKKYSEIKGIISDKEYSNTLDGINALLAKGKYSQVAKESAKIRNSDIESVNKRLAMLKTLGVTPDDGQKKAETAATSTKETDKKDSNTTGTKDKNYDKKSTLNSVAEVLSSEDAEKAWDRLRSDSNKSSNNAKEYDDVKEKVNDILWEFTFEKDRYLTNNQQLPYNG